MSRLTIGLAISCLASLVVHVANAESVLTRDGIQSAQISPAGDHVAIHSREQTGDNVIIVAAADLQETARYSVSSPMRFTSIKWLTSSDLAIALARDGEYSLTPDPTGESSVLSLSGGLRQRLAEDVDAGHSVTDVSSGDGLTRISESDSGSRVVARAVYSNRPAEYYLLDNDAGSRRRLLEASSGLYSVGGKPPESYSVTRLSNATATGSISVPHANKPADYPTVVLLRESTGETGRYDTESNFYSRQRLAVLMVNLDSQQSAVKQVSDAIDWAVQRGHAQRKKVCIVGRGDLGSTAIVAGLGIDGVRCAVSLGASSGGAQQLADNFSGSGPDNKSVHVLMISGADESADYVNELTGMQELLRSNRVRSNLQLYPGEKRAFSTRDSEIRALAATSWLVLDRIGHRTTFAILPMTLIQSEEMSEIFKGFSAQLSEFPLGDAIGWLNRRDGQIEALLSDEQWMLYEKMLEQMAIRDKRSISQPAFRIYLGGQVALRIYND
jgi:dienelactone hydrolase